MSKTLRHCHSWLAEQYRFYGKVVVDSLSIVASIVCGFFCVFGPCFIMTGASTASGHVRHIAILSMQIKIWSWETYLDITCDEFVYISLQWLHF